jgi:hypothetical protein
VTLLPMRSGPPAVPLGVGLRTATTDQNGRFLFEGIDPGRYRVDVQKAGFAPLMGAAAPVDVGSGQRNESLEVLLQRGAVITGRVFDAEGQPLAEAQVLALRRPPGALASIRRLIPGGPMTQTNDLGEFRLFSLPPGEYYLQASPHSGPSMNAAAAGLVLAPTLIQERSIPTQPSRFRSAPVPRPAMSSSAWWLRRATRSAAW